MIEKIRLERRDGKVQKVIAEVEVETDEDKIKIRICFERLGRKKEPEETDRKPKMSIPDPTWIDLMKQIGAIFDEDRSKKKLQGRFF